MPPLDTHYLVIQKEAKEEPLISERDKIEDEDKFMQISQVMELKKDYEVEPSSINANIIESISTQTTSTEQYFHDVARKNSKRDSYVTTFYSYDSHGATIDATEGII